jgi:hypothetical protein
VVDSSQDAHHQWLRAARELATMDEAVDRLLRWHSRTADGLCACCTRPGHGTPMLSWPCPVWTLAHTARVLADSRHGPGKPTPGEGSASG